MRYRLIFFLLFSPLLFGGRPPDGFPASGKHITSDPLGNIYVYDSVSLSSYTGSGRFTARYMRLFEHSIGHVDASNPFKILLFDRETQTLLYLDKQLGSNGPATDLASIGISAAVAVATAGDNGFWLLDAPDGMLYRYDRFLNPVFQLQTNLRIINGTGCWMQQCSQKLLIYIPETGLIIMDEFGNETGRLPQKGLQSPGCNEGLFFGLNGKEMFLLDLNTMSARFRAYRTGAIAVTISKGKAYWLHSNYVASEELNSSGI